MYIEKKRIIKKIMEKWIPNQKFKLIRNCKILWGQMLELVKIKLILYKIIYVILIVIATIKKIFLLKQIILNVNNKRLKK